MDKRLRVLFCGGRNFRDRARVAEVFDKLSCTIICHGAARGADTLCGMEAERRGIAQVVFPANWRGDGTYAAGPIRNQRMLDEFRPDLVVAFPGGTGTEDMVSRALRAGVKVKRAHG